jgi:hypothetical protein
MTPSRTALPGLLIVSLLHAAPALATGVPVNIISGGASWSGSGQVDDGSTMFDYDVAMFFSSGLMGTGHLYTPGDPDDFKIDFTATGALTILFFEANGDSSKNWSASGGATFNAIYGRSGGSPFGSGTITTDTFTSDIDVPIGNGQASIGLGAISISDAFVDSPISPPGDFDVGFGDEMIIDVSINPTSPITLFGGGGVLVQVVPVPPALWLFAGVAGLLALARREPPAGSAAAG